MVQSTTSNKKLVIGSEQEQELDNKIKEKPKKSTPKHKTKGVPNYVTIQSVDEGQMEDTETLMSPTASKVRKKLKYRIHNFDLMIKDTIKCDRIGKSHMMHC